MKRFNRDRVFYIGLAMSWALFLFIFFYRPITDRFISPFIESFVPLRSLYPEEVKSYDREVFGFLPYWNFEKLGAIDYDTLTTLAYFDVKINADGSINKYDTGYYSFTSKKATEIFQKAHKSGVRVVLTVTMMNNDAILQLLDSQEAQMQSIHQVVALVKERGIDGVNIDIEYDGDAGDHYRDAFTQYAHGFTTEMHKQVPSSKVTVSVYASGAKYPKVQDIGDVATVTDGLFMMGYDFALASSGVAMPTAPLGGYKEGDYWYDISTAVDDFLAVMPADKLILGTPWYGLDFEVYNPATDAETIYWSYWGRRGEIQTYEGAKDHFTSHIKEVKTGWNDVAQVGWKAYYSDTTGTWRMIYMDDPRSLSAKYDLAKNKGLLGIGMWAIGYEGDHHEMWDVIRDKFGKKIADIRIAAKPIYDVL